MYLSKDITIKLHKELSMQLINYKFNKCIAELQQTTEPFKMGVLKFEISLRSNFVVHQFDFDIPFIPLGATYMPTFEVSCPVV